MAPSSRKGNMYYTLLVTFFNSNTGSSVEWPGCNVIIITYKLQFQTPTQITILIRTQIDISFSTYVWIQREREMRL